MSRFSVENFLSHTTKTFRRGTVLCCVSENFWMRKIVWIRGKGTNQEFLRKKICLTVPKNAVGEPFSPSLISGIEKIYASEGYVTIFRRNFFVSQYRNIS